MSDERKEPSVRLRACQDAVAASELLVLFSKHVYCSLMSLGMGDTIERVHRDALLLPGNERGEGGALLCRTREKNPQSDSGLARML
jgi:hypothetical protein